MVFQTTMPREAWDTAKPRSQPASIELVNFDADLGRHLLRLALLDSGLCYRHCCYLTFVTKARHQEQCLPYAIVNARLQYDLITILGCLHCIFDASEAPLLPGSCSTVNHSQFDNIHFTTGAVTRGIKITNNGNNDACQDM